VAAAELERAIDEVEVSLDVASTNYPHCGAVYLASGLGALGGSYTDLGGFLGYGINDLGQVALGIYNDQRSTCVSLQQRPDANTASDTGSTSTLLNSGGGLPQSVERPSEIA
jgi:hypothetical protein